MKQNLKSLVKMGNKNIGNQKGEANFYSKLTNSDVIKIRSSPASDTYLAHKFNVSRQHVNLIRRDGCWRHL